MPIDAPQVGKEISSEVVAAAVGGGGWTDALHEGIGLLRGQAGGGAAGQQVSEHGVEAVDYAGSFVAQVVVPLGQQSQDRRLVFRLDLAQVVPEEGHLGNVQGVGRIGLAVPAGGQEPGPGGEGGGHVHHVLAGGGQLLGEAAAESFGSLDGEAALGPPLAPAHQLPDGPCVDDEAPLGELVSCGVDGDGGVGRLVGIDTDGDHVHLAQVERDGRGAVGTLT
nr:hypothetical protein OG999_19720 [Streptomyces sp. NBC_00886]